MQMRQSKEMSCFMARSGEKKKDERRCDMPLRTVRHAKMAGAIPMSYSVKGFGTANIIIIKSQTDLALKQKSQQQYGCPQEGSRNQESEQSSATIVPQLRVVADMTRSSRAS